MRIRMMKDAYIEKDIMTPIMVKSLFDRIYKHIDKGEDYCLLNKGYIVHNDSAMLNLIKTDLHYDELLAKHRAYTLKIDNSWDNFMRVSQMHGNGYKFWNNLLKAAFQVRKGLLVIETDNIKTFSMCWHLKQLAKQERELEAWGSDLKQLGFLDINALMSKANHMRNIGKSTDEIDKFVKDTLKDGKANNLIPSKFMFEGYVLIIVNNLLWDEVKQYAKGICPGQFDAMMEYYTHVTL